MLNKLNSEKTIILKNLSYLTVMRFFNIGFNFLIVAYLIRILGDKNYGLVTWLDSIIQYFLMFINYGFNIYIAKYIVDHRDDKKKINEIVSSVYFIKTSFFIVSVGAVLALSFFGDLAQYRVLLMFFILYGVGEVLFPIWFFQGKENLAPPTIMTFISRLLLVIGVFFFVTTNEDILIYIVILVVSSWLTGLMGAGYIYKIYGIKINWVPINTLIAYLKESFPFFLGRFLLLVFNFGTIFLIGKFCEFEQVAGFDVSVKIVMAGVIPFEMLQQAVFPTISRTQNKSMLRKLFYASIIVGSLIGAFIFIFSEPILSLFGGDKMTVFTSELRVLSLMAPLISTTFILGSCSLVAFGFNREYNFSLISTSIVYLIILVILYVLNQITFWNLIYLRVFGDLLMVSIRGYFSVKKGVLILGKI